MLIVSREMGSRPFGVILTARRAVFIWGDTEVMVPWRIVPFTVSRAASTEILLGGCHTVFELDCHCLVRALHEKSIDTDRISTTALFRSLDGWSSAGRQC